MTLGVSCEIYRWIQKCVSKASQNFLEGHCINLFDSNANRSPTIVEFY